MSKVRLCFAKEGVASYISHLDLLRTFQRVFIRAGMVIRHSAGFHPHPMMSFVLPLSVGQTSVCELLDFETEEDLIEKVSIDMQLPIAYLSQKLVEELELLEPFGKGNPRPFICGKKPACDIPKDRGKEPECD